MDDELGIMPANPAAGIGSEFDDEDQPSTTLEANQAKLDAMREALGAEPEPDRERDRQIVAIMTWMDSQGLPLEFKTEFSNPTQGAMDDVKVTYSGGEVNLKVDPVSSPQPSVMKVTAVPRISEDVFPLYDKDEDDYGITAEQLKTAVRGFIAASESSDREDIEKAMGTAEELAKKLEAMMPKASSPLPEVGPDGRAVPPEGYHAVAGNLELAYQERARERQQAAFKSVVENAAGLTGAILNYIESFR